MLTVPSITALLSVFCYFMFFGAVWAFLEPLGAQFGIDGRTVGLIVSASLAVQVLGAMTATVFEARIDYRLAIAAIGVVALVCSADSRQRTWPHDILGRRPGHGLHSAVHRALPDPAGDHRR